MKRNVLLLLFGMLVSQLCFSQELEIQLFRQNIADLEAAVNPVKDLNDNACALIKVAIAGDDVSFSGSIVGTPKKKNGEYYVYVPEGTKRIQINRPMYLPLKIVFSDYDIRMESKMTYELRIKSPAVSSPAVPIVERQFVIFNVTPTNAIIYIDDVPQETVDGRMERDMACGEYTYRVEAPMYKAQTGSFAVEPSDKTELSIDLAAAFGYLKVSTVPEVNAKVYIDDSYCSETPFTSGPLGEGPHSLRLIKDGYYVFSQSFDIENNKTAVIEAGMKSSFSSVRLVPENENDLVSLNDKEIGKGVWEGHIDPGRHIVKVEREGFQPQILAIEVIEGESKSFELPALLPYLGILSIQTVPSNASVYVDGELLGNSPLRTSKLGIGKHSVTVEMEGYRSQTRAVELDKDEESALKFELVGIQTNAANEQKKVESSEKSPAPKAGKHSKTSFFISPVASIVPKVSFGAQAGVIGRSGVGAYIKYKSNFNSTKAAYDCTSNGKTSASGYIWTTGQAVRTSSQIAAGGIVRVSEMFYLYAGAGFGQECLLWEDSTGEWAKVTDYSYEGLLASAGGMLRFGHFGISLGGNITSFKYADMELGVSFWF